MAMDPEERFESNLLEPAIQPVVANRAQLMAYMSDRLQPDIELELECEQHIWPRSYSHQQPPDIELEFEREQHIWLRSYSHQQHQQQQLSHELHHLRGGYTKGIGAGNHEI